MNNARSTVLGWGALILGAGVSFYFAKKEIDERRRSQAHSGIRPPEIMDWKQRIQADEKESHPQPSGVDNTQDYSKTGGSKEGYQAGRPPTQTSR